MSLPRIELALLPTPLVRATRLERALDAGPIFIKRDDLTGFGIAGNKARALEFLIGAAVDEGADTFVAAGSPSSNFCAAAAMAARVVGMDCELLFPGAPLSAPAPNVELARAAGAHLLFGAVETRDQLDDAVLEHASLLRARGRRPYAVPRGGATATGGLGYALAARELAEQCQAADVSARTVVLATGSGGTQAGLVAGTVGFGQRWRVVGASVSRPAQPMAERVLRLARACAASMGLDEPCGDQVDVRDCRGPGFGLTSDEDRVSSHLALAHEGLLLDDYYGAKAMSLFRAMLTAGAETPAVFWHTGGVAAALAVLMGGSS
ncbi:MAG TPA: pyridoxal-phosphate dependent enzyme [Nocardioides sp.]|uniref:1-aminocyclopropane-1-carboxylate deaminase/D-cysteine desulfhydrase n=1 Tax=Nocardioides sp. TaxID=35761 RepID=UPI002E31E6AF|nr:pyridoxal-phosphate dependent enzyme [Nocardioides sp.]HEX5087761.1 pyridoxal-phosphate dependent enzyme [Nocardioides sp.]